LLDPVVVDILRGFDMFIHHLTPNASLRLNNYMWVCKTMKVAPSLYGFAKAHHVHHQPKVLHLKGGDSEGVDKEAQFACLNFAYERDVCLRVMAYRNKWIDD
ncbi:hypothetical protein BAE44_0001421, partial [Dichanthelium oligosanthes]